LILLVDFERLAILDSLFVSGEPAMMPPPGGGVKRTEKRKIRLPIDTSPEDTGYYL
jgi:hypothetical protein